MTPDTILTLYDPKSGLYFNFNQYEIPAEIMMGGEQRLAVHHHIGGDVTIDAMGKSNAPLEWAGIFAGPQAESRCRYIDGLRTSGRSLNVTWGHFNFDVVIRSFHFKYKTFYRIHYSIALEVSKDNTNPVRSVVADDIDATLASDMLQAQNIGDVIGSPALSSALNAIKAATKTVGKIANATSAAIQSVVLPIQDAQKQVTSLMSQTGNVVSNIATLGGATAGGNTLISSSTSLFDYSSLLNLNGLLARMLKNIRNARHA